MIHEYLQRVGGEVASRLAPAPGFRFGEERDGFTVTDRSDTGYVAEDAARHLRVEVRVRHTERAAILQATLTHHGDTPLSLGHFLQPLRLEFDHPAPAWRHVFAHGGTAEFFYPPEAFRTRDISGARQPIVLGSLPEGRSSKQYLPLILSCLDCSPESAGLYCGMEWSGAWEMRFEPAEGGRSVFSVGIPVRDFTLEPGEGLELPAVHLGFFTGGPDGGTNALRRHLYEEICPPYQGKPMLPRVSYDHWFGIDNQLSEDLLRRQADRAAALGVEVFVVDAAWFPGNFPHGVGNWGRIDEDKFPNGLEPLADYVRSLGMDFGLWFEMERAGLESDLTREHPDWVIGVSEDFLHVDLARLEVQDYIIETVGGWIKRLDIRWSRWDYNINPKIYWDKLDPTGKIMFDYVRGLYRVLDTLMAEHPNWMVECCASGGRRIDPGTLRRAHTCWFSDETERPETCRFMQARANRFLPGHLCNSSVAVGWQQGDAGFDDAAVLSRMLGKLAFDGDIASWSPEWSARAARWSAVFKDIRHLVVQDFYQLLPMPVSVEDADAVSFVDYEGAEAAVFAFAGSLPCRQPLRLKGLRPDGVYACTERVSGQRAEISGAALLEEGIPVEVAPQEAVLWHIRAV